MEENYISSFFKFYKEDQNMETINNDILSDGFRLEGSWASDLKDALK